MQFCTKSKIASLFAEMPYSSSCCWSIYQKRRCWRAWLSAPTTRLKCATTLPEGWRSLDRPSLWTLSWKPSLLESAPCQVRKHNASQAQQMYNFKFFIRSAPLGSLVWICRFVGHCQLYCVHDILPGLPVINPRGEFRLCDSFGYANHIFPSQRYH